MAMILMILIKVVTMMVQTIYNGNQILLYLSIFRWISVAKCAGDYQHKVFVLQLRVGISFHTHHLIGIRIRFCIRVRICLWIVQESAGTAVHLSKLCTCRMRKPARGYGENVGFLNPPENLASEIASNACQCLLSDRIVTRNMIKLANTRVVRMNIKIKIRVRVFS